MQRKPDRLPDSDAELHECGRPSCPGDETLFSLALGELSEAAQSQVEEHVRGCADCREILSEALRSLGDEGATSEEDQVVQQVLVDRYELLEPIGSGGAGVVYRGYDPALKREVAVKILRPDLPGSRDAFQVRLRSEAQATAQLSHPNVVTAYDVGATDSGGFIVLEYFSGGTLEEWFHGEHSLEERLEVMLKAGHGLAAAHDKGLVHRDFKPQNVLMGENGRVCVTDFGLARLEETGNLRGFQMDSTVEDATQTRGLMGTPNYMAPEVFAGARGDDASDQFSFCVALYQALSDRHPFRGGALVRLSELLTRMKSGMIEPWATEVPDDIRKAVERGLSADPRDRFASMNELLAVLEKRPTEGISARTLGGAAALFLLLGTAAIYAFSQGQLSEDVPTPSEVVTAEEKPPKSEQPVAAPESTPEPSAKSEAEPKGEQGVSPVASAEPSAIQPAPDPPKKPAGKRVWKPPPKKVTKPPQDQARFNDQLRDPF